MRSVLLLLTAFATGYQVFTSLMVFVCGSAGLDLRPVRLLPLLGGMCLIVSAVTPARKQWVRPLTLAGCVVLWLYYAPGMFHYMSAIVRGTDFFDFVLFVPSLFLLASTLHSVESFRRNVDQTTRQTRERGVVLWSFLGVVVVSLVAGFVLVFRTSASGRGADIQASCGVPPSGDRAGFTVSVSDKFHAEQLRRLFETLNSDSFQSDFAKYNCGEPAPHFTFSLRLHRQAPYSARRIDVTHAPSLSPVGRTRCLMFALSIRVDKAVDEIDPVSMPYRNSREPHCDCANRDGAAEWVTFPE